MNHVKHVLHVIHDDMHKQDIKKIETYYAVLKQQGIDITVSLLYLDAYQDISSSSLSHSANKRTEQAMRALDMYGKYFKVDTDHQWIASGNAMSHIQALVLRLNADEILVGRESLRNILPSLKTPVKMISHLSSSIHAPHPAWHGCR